MKTLFIHGLILVITLFYCQAVVAQSSDKKVAFGLKIGANFSQLDNLSYQTPRLGMDGLPVLSGGQMVYDFFQQNNARSTGLVGGVFARFGNRFYVQPELLFSVKGGRLDMIQPGLATQSVDVKVGSIDLPILLGMRLGPLRLNAGPMASLTVLDGDLKGAVSQYTSQPFSQTTKQTQLGYQAGVGLTLLGLQLDIRREGGLKSTSSADPSKKSSLRSNLWQLTVGFSF